MPSLINYLCYSLGVLSTGSFIALTLDMANNQATGNNMQPLNKYTEQFCASLAKKKKIRKIITFMAFASLWNLVIL